VVEEPEKQAAGTYVEPVSTSPDRPEEEPEEIAEETQGKPDLPAHTLAGAAGVASATEGQATGPMPTAAPPKTPTSRKFFGMTLPVFAAAIIGMFCLLGLGAFGITRIFAGGGGPGASPATEEPVALVANTEAPTETPSPEPTATLTPEPTLTPTETPIPASPTPDTPYVVITDITLDGNTYVVDYEVHNFPDSPQLHVHMFFDTVPPEQAGSPASGPWRLTWGPYGDPPFTQYGVSHRPGGATQMCSLVANPNHSVQLGTGNCVDLPEN
jgi:hypothetical protein